MIRPVNQIRAFWSEPRPVAPGRNLADWRLLAVLLVATAVEVVLREDVGFGDLAAISALALTHLVLWRRSHPLLVGAIAFTATAVRDGIQLATGLSSPDLHTSAFLLILPYALVRWGSGKETVVGLALVFTSAAIGLTADSLTVGETLGGLGVLSTPIALGFAVRYRAAARARELEDVRAGERLSLARELHDTVAHHVSAIAVRAQAGLATVDTNPDAAADALRVIGAEASRTLQEMREIVRALRDDEDADLAPAPRIEDLSRLARSGEDRPHVRIEVDGSAGSVSPAVSGAVFRMAQEAVTNALRHARDARDVLVAVTVDADAVRLRVEDDGAPAATIVGGGGYGLVGMAERAQLLGGTLRAGPRKERGWAVEAALPMAGADPRP